MREELKLDHHDLLLIESLKKWVAHATIPPPPAEADARSRQLHRSMELNRKLKEAVVDILEQEPGHGSEWVLVRLGEMLRMS